jgi:hypothetical protein
MKSQDKRPNRHSTMNQEKELITLTPMGVPLTEASALTKTTKICLLTRNRITT